MEIPQGGETTSRRRTSKLALGLTGAARSAAMTMTEVQLHPGSDPNIEDADEKKRDRNQVGIENVLQYGGEHRSAEALAQRARPSMNFR
eukprot:2361550-Pyramimonas_sp.AAC.1